MRGGTTVIINGWQGSGQALAEEIDRRERVKRLMS
jgi:hypothetical protein